MWANALALTLKEFDSGFVWGNLDCCQLANDYYKRMTGQDIASEFEYDDKQSALRILAKHGGLEGLFRDVLGEPSDPEPGSVVLVSMSDEGDLMAGGVYNGHYVFTVHPDNGLCRVPSDRIVEAWSCQPA